MSVVFHGLYAEDTCQSENLMNHVTKICCPVMCKYGINIQQKATCTF